MSLVFAVVCAWFVISVFMSVLFAGLFDFVPSTFLEMLEVLTPTFLQEVGCESGLLSVLFFLLLGVFLLPGCLLLLLLTAFFCGVGILNEKTRKWFGYREEDENEC